MVLQQQGEAEFQHRSLSLHLLDQRFARNMLPFSDVLVTQKSTVFFWKAIAKGWLFRERGTAAQK